MLRNYDKNKSVNEGGGVGWSLQANRNAATLFCFAIWNCTTQQEVPKQDSCKLINLLCWQEGHSVSDKTDCSPRDEKTHVCGISVHCLCQQIYVNETSQCRAAIPNEQLLPCEGQPCREIHVMIEWIRCTEQGTVGILLVVTQKAA